MAATATDNAEAAADVQNVLAELKAGAVPAKKDEGKGDSSAVGKETVSTEEAPTEEVKSATKEDSKSDIEKDTEKANTEAILSETKEDSKPAIEKEIGEASKPTSTGASEAAQDTEKPREKREHSGNDHRNSRGGYRGRGGRGRGSKTGNRSDFSQLPDTDDHDEIRKQV